MSHDVFISYSSTDQNAALAVLHGLEAAGIRCWMAPRDIHPGTVWAQAIMEGIAGCRVMVVVFSSNANKSSHVLNEVDAAVRKGAVVIPFRIENVMPDGAMEYHLRSRHWLDALTPDLTSHAAALADQVTVLLQGVPGPAMTPPPREMPRDLPPRRGKPPVKPKRPFSVKRTAIIVGMAAVVIAGAAWWLTRERPLSGVQFTVKEVSSSGGNEMSFRMTSRPLRFFEGPSQIPPLSQRQYTSTFAAGATRYLYPEVGLTYDRPGKELQVPITCTVTKGAGQILTSISIISRIQANWDTSSHTGGWGTDRGGSWEPGRYRFDCSYGGKVIARDWVDVVGGGAVSQNPPPPPVTRDPVPQDDPAPVGVLASIRGRIAGIKLFASGATLPAVEARQDSRQFSSSTTAFIGVQVTLAHQAPGRVVNTQVVCRFQNSAQKEVGRVTLRYQIQPTWTGTINASNWGREAPGFWTPGSYTVLCDDDAGRMIAQQGFSVR